MKLIPLFNSISQFAKVDDEDYIRVMDLWPWKLLNRYAAKNLSGRILYMHHFIMRTTSRSHLWDHKDRDRLNYQKENLISSCQQKNCINTSLSPNNTSGEKNIHWHSQSDKWRVEIKRGNKRMFGGTFSTIEEAIETRNNLLSQLSITT